MVTNVRVTRTDVLDIFTHRVYPAQVTSELTKSETPTNSECLSEDYGLWPLNHLEVTLTRLKLWSSQHMTFVLNLAQSRSFLLLALAS